MVTKAEPVTRKQNYMLWNLICYSPGPDNTLLNLTNNVLTLTLEQYLQPVTAGQVLVIQEAEGGEDELEEEWQSGKERVQVLMVQEAEDGEEKHLPSNLMLTKFDYIH